MHHRITKFITSGCMIVMLILLAGCGEQKSEELVGSFNEGAIITVEPVASVTKLATIPTHSTEKNIENIRSDEQIELQTNHKDNGTIQSASPSAQVSKEDESTVPTATPSSKPTEQVSKQQPDQQSSSTQAATNNQSFKNLDPIPTSTPNLESIKPTAEPQKEKTKSKYQSISWSGFFDNEEQNTPSDDFWDLSEANTTVQIKGFMGEILSLDKNWFLLIPEPGAECPFDNGDETYWNKIMIVYVKDGTKLRYTSKPLQITGRLDVGIKVDESGYKTMFRLYDAKFEEIKE